MSFLQRASLHDLSTEHNEQQHAGGFAGQLPSVGRGNGGEKGGDLRLCMVGEGGHLASEESSGSQREPSRTAPFPASKWSDASERAPSEIRFTSCGDVSGLRKLSPRTPDDGAPP